MMAESIFWILAFATLYAYVGYPLLLVALGHVIRHEHACGEDGTLPSVTLIIPVHNEERIILEKLNNLDALDYPRAQMRVVIVSDGSTDGTRERVLAWRGVVPVRFLELGSRQGKAAALNRGLEEAASEIVVFTDASIMLDRDALANIVRPFRVPAIGCVSGEDHIPGGGGEGLYGRYELFLRNLESRVSSIAGASGSFYAMRTRLCTPFVPGLAPDFLSVLSTVAQGYRAITESRAFGSMASTRSVRREFQRKVRTLLRGMSALWYMRSLLNPFRYGLFAVVLWSHKVARWSVPFFLLGMLGANLLLLGEPWYLMLFVAQLAFFGLGALAMAGPAPMGNFRVSKIAMYFTVVNAAIFVAWVQFLLGVRQEVWEPTRRS
jgi:cellulose synthase/poly-beta-1,6-N-acetylglucosamine synthase-like glycosyltransferase